MLDSNIIFYIFSIFLILFSFTVILTRHPMISLLFLVASFIFSAFMLLMLECEFLAFLFIIIYVGAVAIFFLFAIMMIEIKSNNLNKNVSKNMAAGIFFCFILLFPLMFKISLIFNTGSVYDSFYSSNKRIDFYDLSMSVSDIEVYGMVLYAHFVLQFLLAGLTLLAVLVGVVYLTNTYNVKHQKLDQTVLKQLARKANFF